LFRRQTTDVTSTRNIRLYTLQMVRAFISSYDEYVGEEEEETARTKKGKNIKKNILMARRRENASRGAFALQNSFILKRQPMSEPHPKFCPKCSKDFARTDLAHFGPNFHRGFSNVM